MKSRFQALWLVLSTGALLLLAVGCNDTLRQFITPVPPPTGDPGALAHAITISTNPVPASTGTDMHIDVSGDSSVGTVRLGINPVFLGKSGNRVFAINSGDGGSTPPTVSVYTALLPQSSSVTTVTLPSAPDPDAAVNPVAGGTSNSGNIYIANKGSNNISVIAASVLAVTATIKLPAGDSGPVMIAGNTANNQIFVVNQTSGTVTQISTIDNTVVSPSIPVGSSPVWAVMSTDGLFVFVVNQGSNNVSVIDASLRTVIALIPVGASPNFAFYEPKLQRLYVSNTGAGTVSVIRADNITAANPPAKLKDVLVSGTPTSVTALSNGSRAYAALGNCPAGVNHTTIIAQLGSCSGNLVSVIDTTSLLETATIAVGTGPISIDASSDSSRVFVVNSHDTVTNASGPHTAGTISDIRTSTNTETVRKLAPQQDPNCAVSSTVFCPTQTPFRVITFP
jgi:YVTN family beta-propeller protein